MRLSRPRRGLPVAIAIATIAVAIGQGAAGPTAAAASGPSAHSSVIGGQVGRISEFPWMAHLEYEVATGGWICSGTVIAPRVVLTAAHCAEDIETDSLAPSSTYSVITGVADVYAATHANVSTVSQTVVYPGLDTETLQGDAGLLILSEPVSAPALPLAAPPDSALMKAGTRLGTAGWGMVHRHIVVPANTFHVGDAETRPASFCKGEVPDSYSPATQLCMTGAPGAENVACYGDSGGPAIGHGPDGAPVEIGVFSLVGEGCAPKYPTVYTRVDRISAWADRWIAAVEDGGPTPRLRDQEPTLPFLTYFRARQIGVLRLDEQLPVGFRGPIEEDFRCKRASETEFHCKVAWLRKRNNFYGNVAIHFELSGDEVLWTDRFAIHRVDHRCRTRSAHPERCPVHTLRGESSTAGLSRRSDGSRSPSS